MLIFSWNSEEKSNFIIKDDTQYIVTEKPVLNFEYDSIHYSESYSRKNGNEILSEEQIENIKSFAENFIANNKKCFCVDEEGNYIGYIDFVEGLNYSVPYPADENFKWNFDTKTWQQKYFYDSKGKQTDANNSVGFTLIMPPSAEHLYLDDEWILNDTVTVERIHNSKLKVLSFLIHYLMHKNTDEAIISSVITNLKNQFSNDSNSTIFEQIEKSISDCDSATDKKGLKESIDESMIMLNKDAQVGNNGPILINTDVWKSIDNL